MRARELRQSSPDSESRLWQQLRNRHLVGLKFRRQHPVGRYFADFACVEARLIIELDGGQHFKPESIEADANRTAALAVLGFQVLRFTDREVLAEMPVVLQVIFNWLQAHYPHPSPLPHAGEGVDTSKDTP